MTFSFLPPARPLVDGELTLHLKCADWEISDRIRVPVYRFIMFQEGIEEEAGHINLRLGNTDTILRYQGHIGYAVRPPFRGRRFAARSCRLVLPIFQEHGFTTVWATCNPENVASLCSLELAGAVFVEEVDIPQSYPAYWQGEQAKLRYRFDLWSLLQQPKQGWQ
ncbi:MAG: GNAT family N-acetyltransferase [Candidatus Hydrogenedentes bacterium]|nr:GNAT family N-acetyltransferase [Candidatus Hydrogenedentota bacterium]